MSWRSHADRVIRETLEKHKPKTEAEAKKILRDAYPFGERAMHPYKIWLDAVRKALHRKYKIDAGTQLPIDLGLFAQTSEDLPEPDFSEPDEDNDFQQCANCDLPDACADFGCALMSGVRKDRGFDGIDF